MAKFWLCAAVGLYLLQLCLAQISLNISCRYEGVFHVEKNRRYSLTREEAIELCKALNSTLPTWEQMEKAFSLGLETCRYGYIEEKIVVPRHHPYHLCAANTTGIYVLQSNVSDRYDTYCFNSSEASGHVCDPVKELYSSWPDVESVIDISNADGTRYIGGSLFTESPSVTDDDGSMGSGSANERVTTDPNVITSGVFQTSFNKDATKVPHDVHPTDNVPPPSSDDQDGNDDQHSRNPEKDLDSYEKQKDSSEEYEELGNEGDKYDGREQLSPGSNETSEESEEEEESSEPLNPSGFLEWNSSRDEEHHLSNPIVVSSSDVKHEDSTHDSLPHVVHSGWDNEVRYSANDTRDDTLSGTVPPGDGEHYSTGKVLELIKNIIVTAVSSSGNFLKQNVPTPHQDGVLSGFEAEATLPTNTTSDDLHLGLVPSDEKQNYLEEAFHAGSTEAFINGSTKSTKDEKSHQDQLLSVGKPGGRRKGNSSTNRTSHGVVLIPPNESDHENKSAQTDSSQDQFPWGSDGRSSQNEHEQESSDTADGVSNDVMRHEESTPTIITHGMHPDSEWDREEQYSTNTSNEEILTGIIPPSENERKNTSVYAVSTDGISHEESDHDHLHWDSENRYPKNISRDGMSAVISPSEIKNENNLETDHTVAVIPHGGTHHEDSTHDPLMDGKPPGWDSGNYHHANNSRDDLLPGIIPQAEKDQEKELSHTAVLSSGNTYSEDSAHDMISYSEDKYSTNTSSDHSLPESISSVDSEHENEPTHTVVTSSDWTEHEVSIQDLPNHEADPGWDSGERHQANESTDNVIPGIIFPDEHVHEKEILHTAVVDSTDEPKHEDATNHPAVHDVEHDWSRQDEYPTNSTKDEEGLAVFPPSENNTEEKGFHTAVILNNDAHHEDATQEPDWHTEEEYSTNTSRDDILMGISANSESEHDPLHTDVVSHDGTKDEDSTPEPVKHDSEDKYSTNPTEGVLPPGIVPRRGTNHKNNTYYTGLGPENSGSQQEDSTTKSQPRVAHIPDWLIVVASLLALALILGVCIAVNSRRRCGQKQKLVINNGKGVVDNKNMGGLNGEASKSHEMVHLVHKEQPEDQTGSHDEFLQIDETNNLQEVDLKSGV